MAVPAVLKNYNLFVDGVGYAGKVDEVKLPTLKIKTADHRAGGMDAPIDLDMGMEKMELGFTLAGMDRNVMRQFGLINQNAVQVTFRGALADDSVVTPVIINCRGMYTEQNIGSPKLGDKTPFEANMTLRYFKLTLGEKVVWEIDVENMVRLIDGVDQMEQIRIALGL